MSEPLLPINCKEIARGPGLLIYRHGDNVYIKGITDATIAFNREQWDLLAKIIAYADLKIRGRIE
jgi:hypothetical protein